MTVTKGDALTDFIIIGLQNTTATDIKKVVVQIGVIRREFEEPVFPLKLSFTSEETKLFSHNNSVDIAVYYGDNKKHTAQGTVEFYANSERISSS